MTHDCGWPSAIDLSSGAVRKHGKQHRMQSGIQRNTPKRPECVEDLVQMKCDHTRVLIRATMACGTSLKPVREQWGCGKNLSGGILPVTYLAKKIFKGPHVFYR